MVKRMYVVLLFLSVEIYFFFVFMVRKVYGVNELLKCYYFSIILIYILLLEINVVLK